MSARNRPARSPISIFWKSRWTADETDALAALDTGAKRRWLAARDAVPPLSAPAAEALAGADIILYGPGTQHSSLLPSYRIAGRALAAAPAPVKALVMNLDGDHDIQGLSADDILANARRYGATVTHVLASEEGRLPAPTDASVPVVRGAFANRMRPQVHNGTAVAEALLQLRDPAARRLRWKSLPTFSAAPWPATSWWRNIWKRTGAALLPISP